MLFGGIAHRLLCSHLWRNCRRNISCFLGCITCHAYIATRDFELPILRAHPFQFEPKRLSNRRGGLTTEHATDTWQVQLTDGHTSHRQNLLCQSLQHPAQVLGDARRQHLANKARGLLKELADESVKFLLVGYFLEFSR